jgi:hypothetical protein
MYGAKNRHKGQEMKTYNVTNPKPQVSLILHGVDSNLIRKIFKITARKTAHEFLTLLTFILDHEGVSHRANLAENRLELHHDKTVHLEV